MQNQHINEIKQKIYQQVDELNDETSLQMLQEAAATYSLKERKDIIDELTTEQQQRLQESIKQVKTGSTHTNDEVKAKAKTWLSR